MLRATGQIPHEEPPAKNLSASKRKAIAKKAAKKAAKARWG